MELMDNIFKRCTVKTRLPRQHLLLLSVKLVECKKIKIKKIKKNKNKKNKH